MCVKLCKLTLIFIKTGFNCEVFYEVEITDTTVEETANTTPFSKENFNKITFSNKINFYTYIFTIALLIYLYTRVLSIALNQFYEFTIF